ncbi:MAG: hypothetical protein PWP63_1298 [Methanolobus sp.]|nr:hypothetical protein [Methanolobus sp.]
MDYYKLRPTGDPISGFRQRITIIDLVMPYRYSWDHIPLISVEF